MDVEISKLNSSEHNMYLPPSKFSGEKKKENDEGYKRMMLVFTHTNSTYFV
jgi:hypothetical protein